jgi:hypothetical protein
MGINNAIIRSNLIKMSEYNKLYELKINTIEINFVNSNLIKENNKNISISKLNRVIIT